MELFNMSVSKDESLLWSYVAVFRSIGKRGVRAEVFDMSLIDSECEHADEPAIWSPIVEIIIIPKH